MRKNYDFTRAVPLKAALRRKARTPSPGRSTGGDGFPKLTARQRRLLERRSREARDPTRYIIASVGSQSFILYYSVSDDAYTLNAPRAGTLFKSKRVAEAVRQALGQRQTILRCRVNRGGVLILSSLPKRPQTWLSRIRAV